MKSFFYTYNRQSDELLACEKYEMQEEYIKEQSKDVPIHEQFGCTIEEWNNSCSAWDARHDAVGLHRM